MFPQFHIAVCTSDIAAGDSAFYQVDKNFGNRGAEVQITVNIPKDLKQPRDWGRKAAFKQENASQLQIQTTNNGVAGKFKFKIYDVQIK
jgi:hypothetical protein